MPKGPGYALQWGPTHLRYYPYCCGVFCGARPEMGQNKKARFFRILIRILKKQAFLFF